MKRSRRTWYRVIINGFIIACIIVLAATMHLTFVRATITVPGEKERFNAKTTLEVPDSEFTFMVREYEETERFPVGSKTVTASVAGGNVTILNNYNRNQSLVRTTRLLTLDNKLFRITQSVTVPAGGSVTVFAEADQAGDNFLIGPSRFTIPGLWEGIQDRIYASSTEPMTYERRESSTVTADDISEAEGVILDRMRDKAAEDFRAQLNDPALAADALVAKRLAGASVPKVGTEAPEVTVSVKASFAALQIDREFLVSQSEEKLLAQLPNKERFLGLIEDGITYTVSSLSADEKTAYLEVEIAAWVATDEAPPAIDTKQLAGKTKYQAKDYFTSLGIQNAEFSFFPSWIPRMPYLADHIEVRVR